VKGATQLQTKREEDLAENVRKTHPRAKGFIYCNDLAGLYIRMRGKEA
jgi:hypothetical protein